MADLDDIPNNSPDVTLSEASQAVMDVLAECHGNLEAMRQRLDGKGLEVDVDPSELPSVASRLSATSVIGW